MKKLISMAMAALLVVSLAACGASSDAETSTPSTGGNPTQSTSAASTEGTSQPTTEPVETFTPVVLKDDENVTVRIEAVETDNIWGYTLKVFLENKTDKELMFTVNNVSVNGFLCDPLWAATVDAGMKANEEISFSESDFEKNNIENVEQITFTLRIYDNGDWLKDDLVNETFTITP